jgi:phenylacetic acid degradation operon negative regulatory protein
MRTVLDDSRAVLLLVTADALIAGGRMVADAAHAASRTGRLQRRLRRMEAAGWIGRTAAGVTDERIQRLTEHGRTLVFGPVDPPARWARSWDGVWRLVMFDVPQIDAALRTKLRRQLRSAHFGWLQNSVWLSPDPVRGFERANEGGSASAESLVVFEGRPATGETDAELVAAAWDFSRLARLHADYLALLRLRPTKSREARLDAWVSWLATERRAWSQILRHDPFLPEPLHPPKYAGPAVWQARIDALRAAGQSLAQLPTTP